jgi:NADPH2:quinone reductase
MPRAIQINRYGPPDVLTYAPFELAPLKPSEVRIRTLFAPINRTDLHIRAGDWPIRKPSPFPYVPGVEVIGEIEETGSSVRGWQRRQLVITMMQGLGGVRAERDGGYAELVTVEAHALAAIPDGVAPSDMAALGLGAVTAFEGLRRLGELKGRRIIVTGAAGGVGSAATAIAHAQGASVQGVVRRSADGEYVKGLGASDVIISDGEALRLGANSVDGVLDTVGGDLFAACVEALREHGVLCLVGAVAGGQVAFDGWQLTRPVNLTGYSTETLNGSALQEAVDSLATWLKQDLIRLPEYQILPLAEAARAHGLLEKRRVRGRILLQP